MNASLEVSKMSSRSSGASVARNVTVSMSGAFAGGAGAAADDAAPAADGPGCDCCCACCWSSFGSVDSYAVGL